MKGKVALSLCILLLALLLSGCTVSSTGQMTVVPPCTSGAAAPELQDMWLSWQAISFLAALTVWVVTAVAYALGYVLSHHKVILWAREQMQEAILAMVITFFVIGFISFICVLDMKSLGLVTTCGGFMEPSCSLVDVAYGYLDSMYLTIIQGYLLLIGMNAVLSAAATTTVGFAPGGVGVIFTPAAFLGDVASSLLMATITLLTSLLLTITQMILLKITASLFVILFPIGVILRSFGVTRGFGGGLIAIAIGFFVFYPLLIVLFYGAVTGDISNSYAGMNESFAKAGLSPTNPQWFATAGLLSFITTFIGRVIMGAIFVPLIIFMVLISFIKGLSMALGEEVDVSNLTRLI